ncbi:VTT domain-containing protein [Dongia sp.]|uniref:VTT domain-containing protein n=1 Tax=Dongia sp. TaxID=1977262 RepID=UPI0035AFD77E
MDTLLEKSTDLMLRSGENVWRESEAARVAVLIDAASYFGALRAAMLEAKTSIQIVGWDVDSRTPLVGPEGEAQDGLPVALGDFLDALAAAKPWLTIRILLWDYSVFFATEREPLPTLALRWKRPPQIDLCLDDSVPSGSSHHQKIVTIDDSLAFVGGLDLTIRRWDDSRHVSEHFFRVDPAGKPYAPFHDVQMMLDGPAAGELADLVRKRWQAATCEQPEAARGPAAPWPADVATDLAHVKVGIARTEPAETADDPGIREAERLFLDMIGAAEKTLYIESQYLTYLPVAEAIAGRLRADPDFEAVLICPLSYHGQFERQAMLAGRAQFVDILEQAGARDRCIVAAPRAIDGREPIDISIHSKVMIVDDRYLRIGSANLCNRSMGTDTECDVVMISEDADNAAAIARIRNNLLAEHCGVTQEAFTIAQKKHGSIVAAMRALTRDSGKLMEIDRQDDEKQSTLPIMLAVADPAQPLPALLPPVRKHMQTASTWLAQHSTLVFCATLLIGLTCLSAAWAWSPLVEDQGIAEIETWIATRGNAWNLMAVVTVFVLAGFIAFPIVVLIVATTAIYGIWPGLGYAALGAMSSALATYCIGRWVGHPLLRRFLGPRLNRVSEKLTERGILAVTIIRLLPVAPYTLVNLVSGALRVSPIDYTIGTFLGLLPGFAIMGLVGQQVIDVIRDPSPGGIGLLALLLMLSVGLSLLLQMGISAIRKNSS